MNALKSLGVVCLVTSLTACGGPKRFVIQGYPGADVPQASTFTVKSENGWMKLIKLDGKKGKYVPFASGPGAYAGFEVHLLPGKHTLEVYCWIEPNPFLGATYSDNVTIDVEGQAGENKMITCHPGKDRMHYRVIPVAGL